MPEETWEEQFKRTNPEYAHTWDWDEHPDGYNMPCMCADCRSYADVGMEG